MTHVSQPRTSRSCGQAVVGMILGLSLQEARALFGHAHGTEASELCKVLKKRGVRTGDMQLTRHEPIPRYAILRSSKPTARNWHWMLMWDGQVFDPAGNWPSSKNRGWEITSFIPFTINLTDTKGGTDAI